MYCIVYIPTGVILCVGAPGVTEVALFSSKQKAKKHIRQIMNHVKAKRVEFDVVQVPDNA